jgi:starch synthase
MLNLWVFSFEYAGIIKVGGLGEVPANQTKWLADQYNITLFIPSHGIATNPDMISKLHLKKLDIEFNATINALKVQLGDIKEVVSISFYEGTINGIRVITLVGNNAFSSRILNDPIVYNPDTLSGKFILFSLGMKFFITHTLSSTPDQIPQLIHCHDHHGVPALICCRQALIKENMDVATIVTIHLLTWPRKNLEFLQICGAEDAEFDIFLGEEHKTCTLEDFYRICKGAQALEPTLEKIGVFFADLVTSVSEDYAINDVVGNLGGGWIYSKTDFTWNGCDWDYNDILENIKTTYENQLKALGDDDWFSRKNLRKFLLTRAFSQFQNSEPIISSPIIRSYLSENLRFFPYLRDSDGAFRGKIANFYEDGPLIITTGRISRQKGIDILLDAIPLVLKRHPDARFIFSVLPTEFSIPDIESYINRIKSHTQNVRVIFGQVFSLFYLLYFAADIYCAPSRWEPFGITALEGSITKNIVVASRTGGLQEIVLDVTEWKSKATGMLVQVEKVEMLANSISDLISAIKIDTLSSSPSDLDKITKLQDSIIHPQLRQVVQNDPNFATKMRNNAYDRVDKQFRWKIVTQKLPKLYNQALKNRGKII